MKREKRERFLLILLTSYLLTFVTSTTLTASTGYYLLMQPIEDSIRTGNFSHFKDISQKKISINFEPPFDLKGFVYTEKFIGDFSSKYYQYRAEEIEWCSKQIDEKGFAVQSLNLILKNQRSEETVYYKIIFFLIKINKEWKIYYLKGLKI